MSKEWAVSFSVYICHLPRAGLGTYPMRGYLRGGEPRGYLRGRYPKVGCLEEDLQKRVSHEGVSHLSTLPSESVLETYWAQKQDETVGRVAAPPVGAWLISALEARPRAEMLVFFSTARRLQVGL